MRMDLLEGPKERGGAWHTRICQGASLLSLPRSSLCLTFLCRENAAQSGAIPSPQSAAPSPMRGAPLCSALSRGVPVGASV